MVEPGIMGGSARRRGFSYERDLVARLWSQGFAVMRAPASGARVRRSVAPDVVAAKNGVIMVFEVKTMRKPRTLYLRRSQVERLAEFARRAGGEAMIAVRILDGRGWRFIPLDRLEETGGGFKIPLGKIDSGLRFRDIVALADRASRRLDEYLEAESGGEGQVH